MSLKKLLKYSKQLNVLYVEDEEVTQELYTYILEDIFLKVDIANNGMEAFNKFSSENYDIVISDLCMPIMGGVELCRRIIKNKPEQQIVIMTAYTDETPIKEIKKLGVNTFLYKPIQNEDLINILVNVAQKASEKK